MTVLETCWHRCDSVAGSRTGVSAFGRRVGLGATPLRSYDLQPRNPHLGAYLFAGFGVAPSPRLRRDSSLREGFEPAWAAGGRPATFPAAMGSSMRTQASSHRSPRPLTTSLARSPTLGSRRASAGPEAACSARETRAATTTVRRPARSASVRGSGGGAPGPPGAPAAAREAGGSEGGHRPPRQLQCAHTGYAGLPAVVALVTGGTKAHGGVAVVMPQHDPLASASEPRSRAFEGNAVGDSAEPSRPPPVRSPWNCHSPGAVSGRVD